MPRKTSLLLLPADRPRLSRFLLFLLGCLTTTAFAPFGWYLLLPLCLLPLFYVCLYASPREAASHGFWFGFGLFLSGTYWIYISVVVFGRAPVWIAVFLMLGLVLIMAAYFWLFGLLAGRLAGGEPWRLAAVAPALWVVLEWLRGWLFTGFPWMALGYSQIDSPLAGWAPVAGVHGVSAMLVICTVGLLAAFASEGRWRIAALLLVLLPWAGGSALRLVVWTEPSGPAIRSTLIQGGVGQDRKWLPEQREPTMNFYRSATAQVADSEIVVWPEVAVPSITDRVGDYIDSLATLSRQTGQTILFGILERGTGPAEEDLIYNSVILLDGERRQVYRKRHLVPFGEYFPVPPQVREWMRMMNLPFSDISAGRPDQPPLSTRKGTPLSVAICYEDAYAGELLYALPEAELLVNVSNDAWFGDSIAPHQHLQIARMRSLETGRYTIRATNTGISAFIDERGRLLEAGPQFEPVVMTMAVQPRRGSTPFVGTGNLPIVGLSLLVTALFWLRARAS